MTKTDPPIQVIANAIGVANDDIAMDILPRGKDEAKYIAEKIIAAMGDAFTRKDEATGGIKVATSSHELHVLYADIGLAIGEALPDVEGSHAWAKAGRVAYGKVIEWQRHRKPVIVDLDKCARAIDPNAFEYEGQEVEHAGDKARRARAIKQAKSVLDAAGVAYVD